MLQLGKDMLRTQWLKEMDKEGKRDAEEKEAKVEEKEEMEATEEITTNPTKNVQTVLSNHALNKQINIT
jgi:hypothetical protein